MFDRGISSGFQSDETTACSGDAALLSVSGLVFGIAGKTLLQIQSLDIPAGGTTVIMGPNGAGKSLLLRLLHGLLPASQGSIRMSGEPLTAALCRRQAMVFQSPVILRRSVRANVEFALAANGVPWRSRRKRALEVLSATGLGNKAKQAARSLSGGEQQKLAVVRALATEPEILFLDEPTSNLDPASVLTIERLLRAASAAGTKVVLVTHDLGQARRLGDEVLFLHRGQVVEQTPIKRFVDAPVSTEAAAYVSGELLV